MAYNNISITTNTGLSFIAGEFLQLIHDSNNYIFGQVVSYNPSNGALVVAPTKYIGSPGTYSDWKVISSGWSGSDGTSGTTGTSGSSGSSGTSGATGSSGTNGSSGTAGSSGTSGINGTSGTSGINGTSGTTGTSGSSGVSGSSGTSGDSGSSGTSGLSSSAPGQYLYATRATTNQTIATGTWANRDIIFNSVLASNGISYNTTTGIASLTGGLTYRITAGLAWSAAATYNLEYGLYNGSNVLLSPLVQMVQSPNATFNISPYTLDFIYTPSTNINVKIRTNGNTTALTGEAIRFDIGTFFSIQQITAASGTSGIDGNNGSSGTSGTVNFTVTTNTLTMGTSGNTLADSATCQNTYGDLVINGLCVGRGRNSLAGNIAIGSFTLNSSSLSGRFNVGIGSTVMGVNTTGCGNTGSGAYAVRSNTTGCHNTGIGYCGLYCNTVGSLNTVVGYTAGLGILGSSCNTIIGSCAQPNANTCNNIAIGMNATTSATNGHTVWGNSGNNVCNCVFAAWSNVSDCNDKTNIKPLDNKLGLSFVKKLRPVSFNFDNRDNYVVNCNFPYGKKDGTLAGSVEHYGLVAQELKSTLDELNVKFDALGHDEAKNAYRVTYEELIAPIIKAVQELDERLTKAGL